MNTKKPRGSIFLLTLVLVIPLILVVAGIAVDLSILFETRSELNRTTDAASLAGAGKLGFTSADFPNAYSFAQTYATANPTRFGGTVGTLDTTQTTPCNTSSAPCGRTILGVWDLTKDANNPFTPSSDGFYVNAVQVSASEDVPTYFLKLIGLTSLRATAVSTAVSNPPQNQPQCPLPFAPSYCSFVGAGGFNSVGCGSFATFSSSSGNTPGTAPAATNTSAWIELNPPGTQIPNKNDTTAALNAFLSGNCAILTKDEQIGATNGQGDNAKVFASWLQTQWTQNPSLFTDFSTDPLKDANGNPTFSGKGLKAVVPIIDIPGGTSACTGGVQAINQVRTITGFAWFVVTQATDNQGTCVLPAANDPYPGSGQFCDPNLSQKDKSPNTVFGYYDCGKNLGPAVINPAPRAALATRLRLVQNNAGYY